MTTVQVKKKSLRVSWWFVNAIPPQFFQNSYFAAMSIEQKIKALLRDVHDFPKPGIIFKDITPLLAEPTVRDEAVKALIGQVTSSVDAVAAVEARGFIFGALLAQALSLPFVPVRKAGKLPYEKLREDYALEYSNASIEMHIDAIKPGWRVLVHDDLLATGGTAGATAQLIQKLGGIVVHFSFLINLSFLPGEKSLKERFGISPTYLVQY
jgi:adenine phosphoribosyltransferase